MENKQTSDWEQILKQFKASSLSVKKFAETHDLNYHALNYHIRKKREKNIRHSKKSSEFIQVPVTGQSSGNIKPEITLQVEDRSVTIKVRFES